MNKPATTVDRPLLLVISAPSGAGKTTLCHRLLREFPVMDYSISCTTRPPRVGEMDGQDYYFLTPDEFRRRSESGGLLEEAEVHGYAYGTPRQPVEKALRAGRDVLMDIDVQGAGRIRNLVSCESDSLLARAYVDVFVMPPSMAELRRRLESRGKDSPAVIERRLANAAREMQAREEYQYVVINDDLERAYDELRGIVLTERRRPVGASD